MKAKYTKEELKYLFQFYEISAMPIYYENTYVGKITNELKYIKGEWKYMAKDEYAIELAIEQVDSFVKFKSELFKPFTTKVLNIVKNWREGTERKTEYTYKGTMDEVFEKFNQANRTLRYCNDECFKFADKSVSHLYDIWNRTLPRDRSFHLYYGNGIVD